MMSRKHVRALVWCVPALLGVTHAAHAQTTIDGLIFASFRYGINVDSAYSPAAHDNNFDVDRAYVNVRSKSDGGISTRVTVDVDGRRANGNQQTFRLKYAFVGWTPNGKPFTLKFGLQNTPMVGFVEDTWGYRLQGTIAMDRLKYISSSDFGFAVEGGTKTQSVNYDVGVFDGETYSGAPGDNRKDVEGRVSVRLAKSDNMSKTGGLRLTGFASLGKATGGADRQRVEGMLSYQTNNMVVAAEYALTSDSTLASTKTHGRVLSLWAAYRPPQHHYGFIARLDEWDPNVDMEPSVPSLTAGRQARMIGGVTYQLAKNVLLLVDADVLQVSHGHAANAIEAANRSVFVHSEIKF